LLAIPAPSWKSRDSAGRRGIPTAHKKAFNISMMAMVVKTASGRRMTLRRHGNVKILFSVFFRETGLAGMTGEKSLIQNSLRRVRLARRLRNPLLAATII